MLLEMIIKEGIKERSISTIFWRHCVLSYGTQLHILPCYRPRSEMEKFKSCV